FPRRRGPDQQDRTRLPQLLIVRGVPHDTLHVELLAHTAGDIRESCVPLISRRRRDSEHVVRRGHAGDAAQVKTPELAELLTRIEGADDPFDELSLTGSEPDFLRELVDRYLVRIADRAIGTAKEGLQYRYELRRDVDGEVGVERLIAGDRSERGGSE